MEASSIPTHIFVHEEAIQTRKEMLMAAYFVVEINVTDPEMYAQYRKLVQPTIDRYEGRFLVRGGATQTIEGDWQPQRFVIIEFADEEHFKRWYYSPEYTEARNIRFKASTSRAVLAHGSAQETRKE
jgi:uncharacterized protein (DUF1330 family)